MPAPSVPFRVLFVCTGNICRSPLAERLLRVELSRRLGDDAESVVVDSAGVRALVGEPMDPPAAAALAALGGDGDGFAARQLDDEMLREADLVLTASRKHRSTVVRLAPRVTRRAFTIREFGRLAQAVDPAALPDARRHVRLAAAVDEAALQRGTVRADAGADDDVRDPYGGTAADHEAAAASIAPAIGAIADLIAETVRPGSTGEAGARKLAHDQRGTVDGGQGEGAGQGGEGEGGEGARKLAHDQRGDFDGEQPRRRRWWPIPTLLLLLLLLVAAAWLGWQGLNARDELQQARPVAGEVRAAVVAGDADRARKALDTLRAHTTAARDSTDGPLWAAAAHLPRLGNDVTAVRTMARTLDDVSHDVLPLMVDAGDAARPARLLAAGNQIDMAPLEQSAPDLERAAERSAKAQHDLSTLHTTIPPVQTALHDVRTQVDELARLSDTAATAASLLPPMLGADGPRRYFLAFQNNAEARGTGGLLGAYGVLEADDGRIAINRLGPNTDLDSAKRLPLDLGDDYRHLYGDDPALWVNSNVSPHFPYGAQIWLELWRRQHGQRLDGVIATDPVAMGYVLGATGPATLPGGERVTAENASRLAMKGVYARFPEPGQDPARDAFLQTVARAVFERLLSGQGDPRRLVDAVRGAGAQGRLLVYSRYAEEQRRLEGTSLGGAVPQTSQPYAALVVNNGAGSKMDYYLDRSLRYDLGSCPQPGGRRESRVTVELANTAPRRLPTYVDLRVDKLTRAEPGPAAPASNLAIVQVYGTAGAGLVKATLDGKPLLVTPGQERGHPVFQFAVPLERGQRRTAVLDLEEPAAPGEPMVGRAQPLVQQLAVQTSGGAC